MGEEGLIRLSAWEHPTRQFLFEPVSGRYRTVDSASPQVGAAGCAGEVKVGFRIGRRPTVLVAVYTDGTRLLLSIGERTFDLGEPGLRATRKVTGLFVRRFVVIRQEREVFSIPVIATPAEGDPFKGDIFDYVESATKSRTDRLRTVYMWRKSRRGHNVTTPGFFDELEAFLREHAEPTSELS
jgi:hypothetical protein